jgi:DNA helicase-2/ATP-dependent DNA helicase PcrA
VNPLLQGLNDEQRRAVETIRGPLLILAGAGSGKTRVLTRRIAWLLENGVRPWNILAVTFTNKAAGEMKERVAHLVGPPAKDIWVSTFHSTCVRILRRDIEPLGWGNNFVIYDDDDQGRILKQILAELKLDPKRHPPAYFRRLIDKAKNALQGPPAAEAPDHFPKVYRMYAERLRTANALDFNDLVNKVVELWEKHPDVLDRWRARFRWVLVDEYQDTNPAQYRLVKLLCDHGERNIAVVGDDDQSIYSFRGADIKNILDFEVDFPSATVVRLEQNYRSTGNILEAASTLVKRNTLRKDKTLRTDAEKGSLIRVFRGEDESDEAARVVADIRRQLQTRRPADIAIIYRTNAQSRPFEQGFMQLGIPHVLVGGKKFYERREVRDLVAYLKLIVNPVDDVAFARIINVPTRGVGDKAASQISEEAARLGISSREAARQLGQHGGRLGNTLAAFTMMMDRFSALALTMEPGDLVLKVARDTGYLAELEAEKTQDSEGRIENISALARAVVEEELGEDEDRSDAPVDRLRAFLDRVSLAGQADELPDEGTGAITLLTAHLAKGLEYPVVYVVGLVEKCFPHSRAEREEEIEEERRLAYVAITRARESLILAWPSRRRGFEGSWEPALPSRFLRELPRALLTGDLPPAPASRPFVAPAAPQRSGAPAPRSWLGEARAAAGRTASDVTPPRAPIRPTLSRASPKIPEGMRKLVPDGLDSFREGVEVFHPMLGVGTIARREGTPSNPKLTIHFREHGERTVLAVVAGLEILLP